MRKFLLFLLLISCIGLVSAENVTIDFFYTNYCPHCAGEKVFFEKLVIDYPSVVINYYEVSANQSNIALMLGKGESLGVEVKGVPFTVIGDDYVIGWFSEETTGAEIIRFINDELSNDNIILPFIGEVDTSRASLPFVTVLIGFLDGFNPCAMWVLLFIITLLLGFEDRARMWLYGLTFIFASGVVYFLILAAWLNLFLAIGFISHVRFIVGFVALTAGFLNLKEYFSNKRGGCKVVKGERQKKIFDKISCIMQERNTVLALIGLVALAFMVNLIELVCSAGLPAVYTQILVLNNLGGFEYYSYLLLYTLVFMFDDVFIFVVAMITLKATGVSTKYKRLSNLIGGLIIISVGLLLIFRPDLLMFA